MKKILSILLVLIFISSVVLAGEPNPKKSENVAVVTNGKVVKVYYKKITDEKVKVTIYDKNHRTIFSEAVKNHTGFVRPYNLESLPEGDYVISVQDETEKSDFAINDFVEHSKPMASVIKANEDQFAVLLYSKVESPLRITLFDEDKKILLSEKVNVEGGTAKLYNRKDVKGMVSVEVSDEDGIIKQAEIAK